MVFILLVHVKGTKLPDDMFRSTGLDGSEKSIAANVPSAPHLGVLLVIGVAKAGMLEAL
jgi:hypothetical protein